MHLASIEEGRRAFVRREVLVSSVVAAFSRNRVYVPGIDDDRKDAFRIKFRDMVAEISARYARPVDDAEHQRNIAGLADAWNRDPALAVGRLRIGTAQKALNLHLKYLWCLGDVPEPPHCPFDAGVIDALGPSVGDIKWTKLDCMADYRRLVDAATSAAGHAGLSIAAWELRLFEAGRA